jgi:hypothetical protein
MVQEGRTSIPDGHHPPLLRMHIELKLFSPTTGSGSESQHGITVCYHPFVFLMWCALKCTTFSLQLFHLSHKET